jgi:hypothetical protein
VRSIPEIIRCCFGRDPHHELEDWFASLPAEEQKRRGIFSERYARDLQAFRELPLGQARHVSFHRSGLPEAQVHISGAFGVVHTGGPVTRIPLIETSTAGSDTSRSLANEVHGNAPLTPPPS